MVFWQLTIDANDPEPLARFWASALGYQAVPPTSPEATWWQHYRARLGSEAAFGDRLFDPEGLRPPIWFQQVPESKSGKNRLHLDLYPAGRDLGLSLEQRIKIVEAKVADLPTLAAPSGDRISDQAGHRGRLFQVGLVGYAGELDVARLGQPAGQLAGALDDEPRIQRAAGDGDRDS